MRACACVRIMRFLSRSWADSVNKHSMKLSMLNLRQSSSEIKFWRKMLSLISSPERTDTVLIGITSIMTSLWTYRNKLNLLNKQSKESKTCLQLLIAQNNKHLRITLSNWANTLNRLSRQLYPRAVLRWSWSGATCRKNPKSLIVCLNSLIPPNRLA